MKTLILRKFLFPLLSTGLAPGYGAAAETLWTTIRVVLASRPVISTSLDP
jgi:hypothetical protein